MDNQQIIENVAQFYTPPYLFHLLEEESAEYIVAARHLERPDRPEGKDERFSEMLQEAADISRRGQTSTRKPKRPLCA